MAQCKRCSKVFHACDNCGLLYDWERKYCSEDCFIHSEEYYETYIDIRRAVSKFKLNNEQIDAIKEVLWVFDDFSLPMIDFLYVLDKFKEEE